MRPIQMVSAAVTALVLAATLAGCGSGPEPKRIEVVYFHRTVRCAACVALEGWAKSALAADVEAGKLTWKTLNLDEPANAEFENRYGLVAQSVVVREFAGDKEMRWKNLDKVWDLLDQSELKKYVQDEVHSFMAAQPEATR